MLLEGSWGTLGELLDPPGRLLGGSCSLLGSWKSLRAPLEASWSALGELLGVSWRCLGVSWRILGSVWRPCGSLLEAVEAFEGFLDAPESILEASGGCLYKYMENTVFSTVFFVF